MAKTITLRVKTLVDGKEQITVMTTNAKELRKAFRDVGGSAKAARDSIMSMGAVSATLQGLRSSLESIGQVMGTLTRAYQVQEEAELKLQTVMRQRMNATDAEVDSIKKLASAQQEQGVIGDEVQLAGAQQVATFLNEKASIEALLPAMNNLAVQRKGLNVTQEDMVAIGNMVGKVMQGQTSALRRVGITFTEAEEKALKYGTEQERAAALAQVITNNVGDMNAELAKTDAGKAKQMANAFGDMQEQIGKALAKWEPLMQQMSQIGITVLAVGQLAGAIGGILKMVWGWTGATKALSVAHTGATAVVRGFTTAVRASSVSVAVASGAVKILTLAIRGLMTLTVIGAVIAAATVVLEKLINALMGTGNAAEDAAGKITASARAAQAAQNAYQQSYGDTLSRLKTQYDRLQGSWKALTTAHQKNEWLKTNQSVFSQLGLNIKTINDAESAFVKNTQKVMEAFDRRAQAAALEAQQTQDYQTLMRLQAQERQMNANAQAGHTVRAGQAAVYHSDADVKNGNVALNKKTGVYEYTAKGAAALTTALGGDNRWIANGPTAQENRRVQREVRARMEETRQKMGGLAGESQITIPDTGNQTVQTNRANKQKDMSNVLIENARSYADLAHNVEVYEKRLNAADPADKEATARLREQKEAAEKARDAAKVMIEGKDKPFELSGLPDDAFGGLDAQIQQERVEAFGERAVRTYADIDAAVSIYQERLRTATASQRREIQAQIDQVEALRERWQMVAQGMSPQQAEKRQQYGKLSGQAQTIQQNYEIGIIGKDEAERKLKEINDQLAAIGLKPIKIDLEVEGAEEVSKKLQNATSAIGQMGQSLSGLGSALELPELNFAGVLAQAIATMALSYAQAMASTKDWVTWLAFSATGLAQLTTMINTVKQAAAFAEGGVVSGPTYALVGEYAGARNNPEVIAPLDKLRSIIGSPEGVGGQVQFRIEGRDLVGVMANQTRVGAKSGKRTGIRI